jgi:thiol-disulfide isomerase/thioredoxin
MMRYIFIGICLLLTQLTFGQSKQKKHESTAKPAQISGTIINANQDSIFLLRNTGNNSFETFGQSALDKNGNFLIQADIPYSDYYILKLSDGQSLNIVLRKSEELKVYADGTNLFNHTNFVGSDDSKLMNEFLKLNFIYQQQLDSARMIVRNDPSKQREVNQSFQGVHQQFVQNRTNFIQQNIQSPALIVTLNSFNMEQEFEAYEQVVKALKASYPDSPTVQDIAKNLDALSKKFGPKKPLGPGSEVPDIVMANPEGVDLSLSDYKGKIVLIDFWASWCGPCRQENPNVVKLYNKYKDAGFDIFSVSLDRQKERWVAAIEQDKLTWDGHVSDLKGWQNVAAQAYGVTGIPFTVLLDKEGKVISTNLRGFQLEKTLESIFGF